ncbi:pollen-specific leucine-rich repeat extensin-like protein 3 [Venturia canescens]|uniref:pollen-specific leucine-rich repeat extensin-like protein 3 n=1 Tax=Venturia canescens TaxID=32260 RepID=UPI001C9C76F6|nr:pollen-specific leucine-rich repeat extensin-like protein 3 [Venturia canescens]
MEIRGHSIKMDLTILAALLLQTVFLVTGVSSFCVLVPNEDMLEYSCTGGSPHDFYVIPKVTEKIRITNMTIPRITKETFSRFGENLWVLTCTHCGIKDIEPDALQSLVNLQQLRLDNNHLRDVKSAWFVGMKYLTYLDLNYNEIERIEDGVYANLPSLVDFRISGNRLECLNVEAMSNLADLKRIFLNKNPEFKCPNAVSKFLEDREVSFEKDPEWRNIHRDLVETPGGMRDWSTRPINQPTTSAYHEKLVSTTEDLYDDYEYFTESPDPWHPKIPVATDRQVFTSTQSPYPKNWPTPSPNNVDQTSPSWPASSSPHPNPTSGWPTASPPYYPPRNWPTPEPTYRPETEKSSWSNVPPSRYDYDRTSYRPEVIVSPPTEPIDNGRLSNANGPFYIDSGNLPVTNEPNNNFSPPSFELTDYSSEVYSEIEYPPIDRIGSSATTKPPSNSGYPMNVHSPTWRPSSLPQDYYEPPRASEDFSQPQLLNKFQQVQEPNAVTVVTDIKTTTDKPLPECNGSSTVFRPSFAIVAIALILFPFATIFNN